MEAYHVKRTLNPYMQHAFQTLSFRAMYKDRQLPPVQKDVLALINVPEKILDDSEKAIVKIKDLFPITEKKVMISERNKWINRYDCVELHFLVIYLCKWIAKVRLLKKKLFCDINYLNIFF